MRAERQGRGNAPVPDLHAAYIAPEKKSAEEIARENCVEKRTYYSDLGKAVKPLSALIFGIDGIRLA